MEQGQQGTWRVSEARGARMSLAAVLSAEYQELLAADPVGVAAHHGVEQLLVGQGFLA
jgi:hypothetical protein